MLSLNFENSKQKLLPFSSQHENESLLLDCTMQSWAPLVAATT